MDSVQSCFTLRNGVQIPCVGFGTWQVPDHEAVTAAVCEAIKLGYRHIDAAAIYQNEEGVGEGIRLSGIPREELFITTKLWNTDHGYDATLRAFELSMKKLGLDYCDLYLIHWPNPIAFRDCWAEKNTESWRAMEKLYGEGRVRAIGVSNFWAHHIQALLRTAVVIPMVNQIHLNPADEQAEVVSYCRELGILLEAYSPLGHGGVLTQAELLECAARHGKTPAQICLRWSLQKGFVPLPKSVTPSRIKENLQIFDFDLDESDFRLLSKMEGRFGPSSDPDHMYH